MRGSGCHDRSDDRSSRKQLRAYIHVESTQAKPNGPKWSIGYKLKNAGLTPATWATLAHTVRVVPWPIAELPQPEGKTYLLGTMSPLGDTIDFEEDIIVTADDLSSRTQAILLVGKVTYRDAFGRTQTTDFRYYVTGEEYFPEGGKMYLHERGNQST
jgi:hypothetical protein